MSGNMIGRVFNDRYQLTERIGIGGMAEVYRAQDRVLGRVVAVKVMLPQYAADPEFTARFRQEAASAANLQSPYIVNVYDWGQDEGTYFIVMEFVRGSDLKTAIQQRGAINQRKVAEIGAQVCKALSVAHNQDIIHRDIKPQNIMIQPDGNVKVMDFGIARAKNSTKGQTEAVLGTAHYISPEQAQGKELTASSDMYSLGVVLYEAATGKLPFDGPDSVSVAMKQVSELPVPPTQINPAVDPALEDIILRAMEKKPENRFDSISDMRHALEAFLSGRSQNSVSEDDTQLIGGYDASYDNYDPYSGQVNSTSVMPAVDGGMGGGTPPRTMKVDTKPQRRGPHPALIAVIAILVIAAIAGAAFALGGLGRGLAAADGTVPDVTGKSVAAATSELTSAGYTIGATNEVYDATVAVGSVVSTDPAAGTKAAAGTTVNLNVSKGQEELEVPNLVNMTADQAKAALNERGLTAVQGTDEFSADVAQGNVCRQDPVAGAKVQKGATITFYLSKGSDMVEVPNIVGYSETEAQSALTAKGLSGTLGDTQSSSSVAKGNIISQNPSAGTKVAAGTKVTYVISSGPEEGITVPSILGMSESSAASTIEALGLSIRVYGSPEYSTYPEGTVADQEPKAGETIQRGGTVYYTLSAGSGSDPEPDVPSQDDPQDGDNSSDSNTDSNS